MFVFLNIFWLVRTLKYVLFWLYLWQLKEYHVGRFLDHFNTSKGRKIFINFLLALKIILLLFFYYAAFFVSALTIIYVFESVVFSRQIILKSFKKPVFTIKSISLALASFLAVILFLVWSLNKNPAWLLIFDILTPVIVSVIVLAIQPVVVFMRNQQLKKAAEKIKQFPNLKVIAITGSYGKTSTKEFLKTILERKFNVLATDKHQNAEIGIAKCILNDLKKDHEIFIAEVGAYNKGKVKQVCWMLKPKIGIVTGVNQQHLALFGSLDNLLSAEGGRELASFLEKEGLLIVNGDNKYCLDLIKRFNGKEKIYTEKNKNLNSEIWTESISMEKDKVSFLARNKKGEMANFSVNVLGKQNVQNLLAAILTAGEFGMNFSEILEACQDIQQSQAGMVFKKEKHGIYVIDSSYSSNPDGVMADLDYLSIFSGKKIVVMPCLIELGARSAEIHEEIGRKIGGVCNLAMITSKDYFKDIERGFMETKPASVETSAWRRNILLCDKPEDIYSLITLSAKANDAVLLEGRVPSQLINLLK